MTSFILHGRSAPGSSLKGLSALRDRVLLSRAAVGVLLISVLAISNSCSRRASGSQIEAQTSARPVSVRVSTVEAREIRRNVEAVGSLFAYEEVTVSSEVEGRSEEVLVDVGDRVAKGQPLVRVLSTELELSLEQQQAALDMARAKLGLRDGVQDLKDANEAAEVKAAAAQLDDADQKFERAAALLKEGVLPRQSYEEAEARYKSARAAYDLAVQGVHNLRAQVAQYRASLELAKKKLNDSTIRAPFGGEIKERAVTKGQYLKVQTPVYVIVQIDPLRIRLKVPEKMAAWVKIGQAVTIQVEAYADRSFTGKITRLNPSVDQQSRTFDVEAVIDNPQGLLKPGFFVKATIPSTRVDKGLFASQEAVQYVYGIYKVLVVDGGTLKEKEVKVGDRSGGEIEITDGISEGDLLALPDKGRELKEGTPIEVAR
jgi:RND family efflux transporter MFP subunit